MASGSDRERRKVLLESTGMVTELLETVSGEPIDAERMWHEMVAADSANLISVDRGHKLLHRVALLRGRVTHKPYLYAESFIACHRLPEAICSQLQRTNAPLGRTLASNGLSFRRTLLGEPLGRPMSSDEDLLALIRSANAERSYLIFIDDAPLIAINEWFLPAALQASLPLRPI
jgi:chorismate-pyruvate lyase